MDGNKGICSRGGSTEQLPGQMNVYDYEEVLTDEMRKGIRDGRYRRSNTVYELRGDFEGVPGSQE